MKKLAVILVLWMPFSIGAILSVPVSLFAIAFGTYDYAKNVLRAMDKLTAAVFGFSGYYSLSAECGKSECKLCNLLCALLDRIEKGHCSGAAKKEGLT